MKGSSLVFIVGVSVLVLGFWRVGMYLDEPIFATDGSVEWNFRTNSEEAIMTMTNLGKQPQYWCGRGIVSNKTGATAKSLIVCTGIKSKETVEIKAPYRVGAIRELCGTGKLLIDPIDWDKCSFTTEPVR
jgi:hypothetical protein